MKYCSQCGKPVTGTFCAHCGTRSEVDAANSDTQPLGWNSAASKNEEVSVATGFHRSWWFRGAVGAVLALGAYNSLPVSWKDTKEVPSNVPTAAPITAQPTKDPLSDVWVNAAREAVTQYEMVKKSGSPTDVCIQASVASQAFLQASDEPNYAKWKRTEILDCGRAGIGDQSAYLKALAEDMKEKGGKSELAQQVKGLVGQPDAQNQDAPNGSSAPPNGASGNSMSDHSFSYLIGTHPQNAFDSDTTKEAFLGAVKPENFEAVRDHFAVASEIVEDNGFIVGHGCEAHQCDQNSGIFFIDIKKRELCVVVSDAQTTGGYLFNQYACALEKGDNGYKMDREVPISVRNWYQERGLTITN